MKCAHCGGSGEIATPKLPFGKPIKRSTVKVRKQAAHRLSTSEIREKCMARAQGTCECGCGEPFTYLLDAPEMDHRFGGSARRSAQSVETCWILSRRHHYWKTINSPSAAWWEKAWREHCARHSYSPDAPRLTKTIARAR